MEGGLCTATASDVAPGVGPHSVHGPPAKASGFTLCWGAPALPFSMGAQRRLSSEDRRSACLPSRAAVPRSSLAAPHPPSARDKGHAWLTAALSRDPI